MSTNLSQWPLPSDGIRIIVPQFMRDFLAENALSRECYPTAFGYYPNASGHRMARHEHHDNLFIYCTAGCGVVEVQGRELSVQGGDAILLPRGSVHSYRADAKIPWTIYWVHFEGELADQFIGAIKGTQQFTSMLSVGTHVPLIADFGDLIAIRKTGYNRRSFIHGSNLLRQMLSYLSAVAPTVQAKQLHNMDLEGIHALMEQKLNAHLDLATLASYANLSKYHFSNKYKALTGHSPIQHFLHLKMERACYLLDLPGSSVQGVARTLGYEDSYYFSRLFKKIIGVAPRQYRILKRG